MSDSGGGFQQAFGQFASNITQEVTTLDPITIQLDQQEDVGNMKHTIDFENGDIIIKKSGVYLVIAAPQIGKTSGNRNRWIDFWLRINQKDVPNSTVRRVLTDKDEKDVIPLNSVIELNKDDVLNIMMAAETTDEGIRIEHIEPENQPTIPSIIVTIVQLD